MEKGRKLVCKIEKYVQNGTKLKVKGSCLKQYSKKTILSISTCDIPFDSELNREFRNIKCE